ncbi:MarR family transcriptional regulator [Dactylosporangium cerinum]
MNAGAQPPPGRLRSAPSWLINQASAHSHRLVVEGFAAVDARGYHYRLLAALADGGPASQAELGRRTGIDRSDVVAALNELADQQLIERPRIPGTAGATSSPRPRRQAVTWRGSTGSWRRSRRTCAPRCRPLSGSSSSGS